MFASDATQPVTYLFMWACKHQILYDPLLASFSLPSLLVDSLHLDPRLSSHPPPFPLSPDLPTANWLWGILVDLGPLSPQKPEALTSQLWVRVYVCECVSLSVCACVCSYFQGLDIQKSRGPSSLPRLTSVQSTATSVNLYHKKNSQVLLNGWDGPGCGAVCGYLFVCKSNMDDFFFWKAYLEYFVVLEGFIKSSHLQNNSA